MGSYVLSAGFGMVIPTGQFHSGHVSHVAFILMI